MKNRLRWTILLGTALSVVGGNGLLAQSLDAAQLAALENFWGASAARSQPQVYKAAVVTSDPETWKIVVRFGDEKTWHDVGELHQISKSKLTKPVAVTEQMRNAFDLFEASLLLGETHDAEGKTLYVVAVLLDSGPLPVPDEGSSFGLVPLMASPDADAAADFARAYDDVFDGVIDDLPDSAAAAAPFAPKGSLDGSVLAPKCTCDEGCQDQYTEDKTLCGVEEAACSSAATAAFLECIVLAGGVPLLEGLCTTAYLASLAVCASHAATCINNARANLRLCLFLCDQGA